MVFAEDGPHGIGDFAERGPGFDGSDDRRHQVDAVARGGRHRVEPGAPRLYAARGANGPQALDLLLFDFGVDS